MSFQAFFSKMAGILRAEIHSKARKCSIFAIKVHKCGVFMTKVHNCDICCVEHAQNHKNTGKITKIRTLYQWAFLPNAGIYQNRGKRNHFNVFSFPCFGNVVTTLFPNNSPLRARQTRLFLTLWENEDFFCNCAEDYSERTSQVINVSSTNEWYPFDSR